MYSAMMEQGQGNTEVLREKTNPVPPYPPQISHNFTWYQTWTSSFWYLLDHASFI